jgi:hypothetical protein
MAANTSVYGLYKNRSSVEEAVSALKLAGREADLILLILIGPVLWPPTCSPP